MLLRILLPILILAAGAGGAWWLGRAIEKPAPRHVPPQKLKTEVQELRAGDYQVILESQGVIRAHHETTLTPLVGGTVITVHSGFEDGAFFKAGEILIELEPADFQAELTAAESQLARSEAALAQEEARAKQARLNWEDLGYADEPSDLVLRLPQMKEARAAVDSALANLDQARRNLQRTKVRAPFDGRVRARTVGLGQSVGAATPLGDIYATDFAEIRLPLTPEQLRFVNLPSHPGDPEVAVTLTDALGIGDPPPTWKARIVRTEGALDESSRELFAIARIDDPFQLTAGGETLRIGQPVRATIHGNILEDVFVIPRDALRGIDVVYLVDQAESAIIRTTIAPVWSTSDTLIVRDGFKEGDLLSVTRLPYAPNGAPVEIIEAADSPVTPPAAAATGAVSTGS